MLWNLSPANYEIRIDSAVLPCETPLVSSLVFPPLRNPHPAHYALPLSCKNFCIDLQYIFGQYINI